MYAVKRTECAAITAHYAFGGPERKTALGNFAWHRAVPGERSSLGNRAKGGDTTASSRTAFFMAE